MPYKGQRDLEQLDPDDMWLISVQVNSKASSSFWTLLSPALWSTRVYSPARLFTERATLWIERQTLGQPCLTPVDPLCSVLSDAQLKQTTLDFINVHASTAFTTSYPTVLKHAKSAVPMGTVPYSPTLCCSNNINLATAGNV
jgi:hypothetical protein